MFKQVLLATMLTAGLAAVSAVNAASTNPLHPSFERNFGASFAPVSTSAIDTSAARNPLNPAFYQARIEFVSKADAAWYDASANNPLHPSYRRS